MEFYKYFEALSDPTSTDVSKANEFLNAVLIENPTQFILSLIEIVRNEEVPQNIRRNALISVTIPIKRKDGSPNRNPNVDFSEIIQPVFDTLFVLLQIDDDNLGAQSFGHPCVEIFTIFTNVLNREENVPVINSIFEKITEGIPDFFLQRLLTITSNISSPLYNYELVPQYISSLATFFASIPTSDFAKHFFLLTVANIINLFDFHLVTVEFTGSMVDLVWTYATDFPKECSQILEHIIAGFPEVFTTFPDMLPTYISVLQSSLAMWPFLNLCFSIFGNILEEHWSDILIYCISILENDTSTLPIGEDEYHDNDMKIPVTINAIELVLELQEAESIQLMMQYISEHIEEKGTPAKVTASILANRVGKKQASDILFNNTAIEHNTEERQAILFALLQDDSARVMQQAIDEAASLVSDGQLEPDEALLSYALTVFFSDFSVISDCASELLSAIANSDKEGAREAVVGEMLKIIQQYENVEKVADALRVMTSVAHEIDAESALGMIEEVLQLAQTLVTEHFSDPTIGPCIGFLSQLIRTSGPSCADYVEACTELASTLTENDLEDDGMFLLSSLVDIFSESSPELVKDCIGIILENINNPSNIPNLKALLSLTSSVVNFIDDGEALDHIVGTCLNYLSKPPSTIPVLIKTSIIALLTKMNEASPEYIAAHAYDILEMNRSIMPLFTGLGEPVLRLALNIANATEDGCENINLLQLLLQALRSVARNSFNLSEDKASVIMQILVLLQQKTPISLSQAYLPINITTYNAIERLLNEEQQQILQSICPRPEAAAE